MHLLIIGGSDAGISAGLRAREVDPVAQVTLLVADAYPNFSICGIPYYVSGEVTDWRDLAHRTQSALEATGMRLLLEHTAQRIDPAKKSVTTVGPSGEQVELDYDRLVIGTGAVPVRPPISGLDGLGPHDGVHLLHTMDDTFGVVGYLDQRFPAESAVGSAVVVGAGVDVVINTAITPIPAPMSG